MRLALLALPGCLALAGCASSPLAQTIEPIDGIVSGQCHTDMVRGAVGLAASATTVERARVDSDSTEVLLVRGQGDRPASATLPEPETGGAGGPRLVIETGSNNAITALRCG
ncbi:hypothetical protein [Pseudoxanthomonas suwonensis]|uniref:hypothetical protein n=1 Tax=Pseudoxanthomonas suwonensis TaxID=314722 RepID=UPI00138F8ED5|nr:hypothetical protein [Pseudoxanthomonas suwonensis]KAF1700342.1 hypothetical protein CSC68_11915 [Pseudoxanthomonas suwonensis]